MHLTKYIALHTQYSRRKAEELIKTKRVTVNNSLAKLGQTIALNDKVHLNNKLIIDSNEDLIVLMVNKPTDYTCTKNVFKNEKNIYQLLPKKYQHLNIIGRLDKNSQGLLLLTNNGDLVNQLSHPKFEHKKVYQVKVNRELEDSELEKIRKGIKDNQEILEVKDITKTDNYYIITLTEGKNRHIRRIFKKFNVNIITLKRIAINNLTLDNLKLGKYKELGKEDLKDLYFSEKWLK